MPKKPDPDFPGEIDTAFDRMGFHFPPDLGEEIRVEAARRRESLNTVVTRRLRESYAKSSKRESANAL